MIKRSLGVIIVGVLFTGLYLVESFWFLAAAIHGSLLFIPVGFAFALVACTVIWRRLLFSHSTAPLGRTIGLGLVLGAAGPLTFVIMVSAI